MKAVKFGKHYLVFGAKWVTLPGANTPDKEIKNAAKQLHSNYYVSIPREGGIPLVGFIKSIKKGTSHYSAASLIPKLVKNLNTAIFLFKLDVDEWAAICFLNGLPLIGYDQIGSPHLIKKSIDSFRNFLGENSEKIKYYGDEYSSSFFERDVSLFNFHDQKLNQEVLSDLNFKKIRAPKVQIFAVAIVAILFLCSYFSYDFYQEKLKKSIVQPKIDANIAYENNVRLKLKESGYVAHSALIEILPDMANLPLFMGGWKLEKNMCQVGTCLVTWTSDDFLPSTFDGFKLAAPAEWSSAYQSNFKTVNSTILIKSNLQIGVNHELLPKYDDFMMTLGSDVQRMKAIGIDLQITSPELFAVPTLPPDQPPITSNILTNPVKEGTWSVIGAWPVINYVQGMGPNMVLSSITTTYQNQIISIQANGKYYVSK